MLRHFFRETELKHIKVGDCATVYVMADRQRAIQGRVEGIGWGVSSEDMLNIPRGLPYVPKSLNWVRVVQRFPVRISLEKTAGGPDAYRGDCCGYRAK